MFLLPYLNIFTRIITIDNRALSHQSKVAKYSFLEENRKSRLKICGTLKGTAASSLMCLWYILLEQESSVLRLLTQGYAVSSAVSIYLWHHGFRLLMSLG